MFTLYKDHSDAQLVTLLAEDDQAAFDALYERYFTRLFNYAYQKTEDRFTAQEVVQELFIHLWQQRRQLTITGTVSGYAFASAKHLIIDQYRRQTTRSRHADAFANGQSAVSNQTEEQVRVDELLEHYERSLGLLPEKCRQVFVLSRQGFTNREIARQLAISEKTVEQHITKALRLLRQHLPEHLTLLLLFSLLP